MKEEPEKLYDVVIYEIATGKIDSIIGRQMRQWDGNGSGRNSADLRVQTGKSRVNDKYSCKMVEAGRYGEGDTLESLVKGAHERQEVKARFLSE